jgi:hypothetical protein
MRRARNEIPPKENEKCEGQAMKYTPMAMKNVEGKE